MNVGSSFFFDSPPPPHPPRRSLVLLPSDRDVVGPDDVDQQFDVSVRQVLRRHLLPLLPLGFQRPLGLGQLEQVDSQEPARVAADGGYSQPAGGSFQEMH